MTLSLLRPLIALNSPQGRHAKLSVLIFHRVLRQSDPLVPGLIDAARFEVICGWLRSWFKVLPLDQALVQLRAGVHGKRHPAGA